MKHIDVSSTDSSRFSFYQVLLCKSLESFSILQFSLLKSSVVQSFSFLCQQVFHVFVLLKPISSLLHQAVFEFFQLLQRALELPGCYHQHHISVYHVPESTHPVFHLMQNRKCPTWKIKVEVLQSGSKTLCHLVHTAFQALSWWCHSVEHHFYVLRNNTRPAKQVLVSLKLQYPGTNMLHQKVCLKMNHHVFSTVSEYCHENQTILWNHQVRNNNKRPV